MNESEELKDLITQKWDEIKQRIVDEAKAEERKTIKAHFDYCHTHCGHRTEIFWMRNEIFGKD